LQDANTPAPSAAAGSETSASETPVPTQRLVLQFFLGPLLIVLLCAGIYYLFGVVVFDKKSPSDFLLEIRSGSASERWQAAFELSRWFASSPPEARDPEFARQLIDLYRDSAHDDPRVRRYLALALGRLGDPAGAAPLLESLQDPDGETRLYAIWSLGALRERSAVEPLVGLLGSDDAGLVKMSAYALGAIGDAGAAPALRELLEHPAAEIRWNAALALARLGDSAGLGVLLAMTDPAQLARVEGLSDYQKSEAMTNALKALHSLGDERARARIRELAQAAPYPEVREAAAALAALSP
jgi:HEAT repeat protein